MQSPEAEKRATELGGRKVLGKLPHEEQFRFGKYFNRQVQTCLDRGLGECHLRNPLAIACIRSKFMSGDGGPYHAGDFATMPNHVHLLMTPTHGQQLETIPKSIKGASAVECNRHLGRSGAFWQADSYDHIVRSLEQLAYYRRYIADNPAKASTRLPDAAVYHADWMDEWLDPS